MERFWQIFWKIFGIMALGILIVAGVVGIVSQSFEVTYDIVRYSLAGALAICGGIGLLVPVGLYLEYRKDVQKR